MLSVAQARAIMVGAFAPLAAETIPLDDCHGRVLAQALLAGRDQPPFDASAMDGYALASAAAPGDYQVVGESAAGRGFSRALRPSEAIRISTGAPLPAGADGVLIQEDAKLDGDRLLGAQVRPGRHVRRRACDFAAAALLLEAGRKLDPVAIALAASAGSAELAVTRRPRVTVFAGGDEVVAPGGAAGPDQVYESGSFAVCGLIRQWGGQATRGATLPDDEGAIAAAAANAFTQGDLIVLIGGASVGPHDHARPALARLGVEIGVDKVAVKPGKPTWFGIAPAGRVLGLPGNPASAIVCAHLFLRPIVARLLGMSREGLNFTNAPLANALEANGGREAYLRARLDEAGQLHVFDNQDSSLLSTFAAANALAIRPPNAPAAAPGERLPALRLD
jgi:molybdopterin molybdotransferase